MRDYNHPAFRSCHFGTSGIGKTTDFVIRLKQQGAKASFVFIHDHKREFAQKLGKPVVTTAAQLVAATSRGGWILWDHCDMFPGDRAAGFRYLCKFIYECAPHLRGRKILVADEVHQVAGPHDDVRNFVMLMDDGRSLKIDAMFISQGANRIHESVRNQITECFVFRQADKNSLEFLTDNGFDEDQIRNLRPGEWLWRNLNSGQSAKGGKAFKIDGKGTPSGGTAT